ncbi:hypothetical protein [Wukongibacter sp. M2B1]|uniref:hypothetical protein n=1 Tax=Wukongibacter sp. M2B1 TaxID=3088895 RepID=UPI003D7B0F01
MDNSGNRNNKIRIWPVILGAIVYIILNEIFDIPNLYAYLKEYLKMIFSTG